MGIFGAQGGPKHPRSLSEDGLLMSAIRHESALRKRPLIAQTDPKRTFKAAMQLREIAACQLALVRMDV